VEFATLTRTNGKVEFNLLAPDQITALISELEPEKDK
jgi:hypothetical protein